MKGWKKEVKAGAIYPVVYTRTVGGRTYRVAPSSLGTGWALDILDPFTGWERHAKDDGKTPEEAASFLTI